MESDSLPVNLIAKTILINLKVAVMFFSTFIPVSNWLERKIYTRAKVLLKPAHTVAACAFTLVAGALMAPIYAQAISGGLPADVPWVVRVIDSTRQGTVDACVGAAVSQQIIITTSHCKAAAVVFAEHTALVANHLDVPGTQIRLLTLVAPYMLREYATLGQDNIAQKREFPAGTPGIAYSYPPVYPEQSMKRLDIRMTSHVTNESWEVFHMTGGNGELGQGDSGGPMVINGLLVGVFRAAGKNAAGSIDYLYDGVSPALSKIHELEYQLKVRAVVASEL